LRLEDRGQVLCVREPDGATVIDEGELGIAGNDTVIRKHEGMGLAGTKGDGIGLADAGNLLESFFQGFENVHGLSFRPSEQFFNPYR
jgi:hypothetical protein